MDADEQLKQRIADEEEIQNINYTFNDNKHIIHFAALYNNMDLIKKCLSSGVGVDVKGGKYQSTPLYFAVYNKNHSTMLLLLENGANPNYVNLSKNSLQKICICRGDILSFLLLDIYNVEKHLRSRENDKSLKLAVKLRQAQFVNYLKKRNEISYKLVLFFAVIHFISFIYDADSYIIVMLFVSYHNLLIYIKFMFYLNIYYSILFSIELVEYNLACVILLIPYYIAFYRLTRSKTGTKTGDKTEKIKIVREAIRKRKFNEKEFCAICLRYKNTDTKHCNNCNVCVDGFDHHCPCLDNCVCAKMSALFYFYLLYSITLCFVRIVLENSLNTRFNLLVVFFVVVLLFRVYVNLRFLVYRERKRDQ
ncbi:Ankyrin repeat and DHHC-type Zn-finger domain containing protein [Trachipleistophora hominis]|uniref:Palmitoyltransferase n=1 Tax=Trachipleistophora hominis TaxID=72359 RepID=L7JYA0_TRAHO|nr:Ankyrin repeat and DHHC-type Zn-finger domain containing protein [Trachipleistophora hominis]